MYRARCCNLMSIQLKPSRCIFVKLNGMYFCIGTPKTLKRGFLVYNVIIMNFGTFYAITTPFHNCLKAYLI